MIFHTCVVDVDANSYYSLKPVSLSKDHPVFWADTYMDSGITYQNHWLLVAGDFRRYHVNEKPLTVEEIVQVESTVQQELSSFFFP